MIPNYHGIVKFEMAKRYTLDDSEPTTGWETLNVLTEETAFNETLDDGIFLNYLITTQNVQNFRFSYGGIIDTSPLRV